MFISLDSHDGSYNQMPLENKRTTLFEATPAMFCQNYARELLSFMEVWLTMK